MKYVFEMNSRVNLNEPAELKHNKIIDSLKNIPSPWGINSDLNIPFPDFNKNSVTLLQLKKFLSNGIKMDIMYRYRNMLDDHHSSDDRIFIEFNSEKIEYYYLTEIIFPQYVNIFGAYRSAIYNELLIYKDFEKSRNKNYRKSITRIYPVTFYDSKFCKDVFKMAPREIYKKLNGKIYKVSLHNDGIILIANVKPLSVKESDEFDKKVRMLLDYEV